MLTWQYGHVLGIALESKVRGKGKIGDNSLAGQITEECMKVDYCIIDALCRSCWIAGVNQNFTLLIQLFLAQILKNDYVHNLIENYKLTLIKIN